MSGIYVARLDLAQPHLLGVARKIEAQIGALAQAGLPARLLCLRGGAIELDGQVVRGGGGRWTRRVNHHWRFHAAMEQAARGADFAYIRFQGAPPPFVAALGRMRRATPSRPVAVEFPSWPFATERRGMRARLAGRYEDLGLARLHRSVDRIVTFSQASAIFGIPTLRIDNGVDVTGMPVAPPAPDAGPLRLTGVANLSFWHGYDRVIAGLAAHRKLPGARPVAFDIVGHGAELPRLQAQAAQLGLEQIVRFPGPLHGAALDAHLAQCHIGISSIGMHRLDVDTSNIKSREFCARGLPFAIGYPDRDFPHTLPFVFHVAPDDSPLDIAAIANWYENLRASTADVPGAMRAYAEAHLTWHTKLAPVIEWLRAAGNA